MKILAWSPSSIDQFANCPRQFVETRVHKNFKSEQTQDQIWGEKVHKHFEERMAHRTSLPKDLKDHEMYMIHLEELPGHFFTEQKIAFDLKMKPCGFFDRDVWCRGVIDYQKVDEESRRAWLADYKTGKPHEKWRQLALYALHTFASFPFVDLVNAQFYWTQTQTATKKVWGRAEIRELWGMFLPDLKQYKEAFDLNTWQPRPSGLCKGWCPVTSCEFHGRGNR